MPRESVLMLVLLGASIAFMWTMLALSFTIDGDPPAVMALVLWPAYVTLYLAAALGGLFPMALLFMAAFGALAGLLVAWLVSRY